MLPTIALEIVTDVTLSFNESLSRQLFHRLQHHKYGFLVLPLKFDKKGPFIQVQLNLLVTYGCQSIETKG